MQVRRRQAGVALVLALATMVVIAGIATLMFTRTVAEIRHSGDDQAIVETLMLARGAANAGGSILAGPVRDRLEEIVRVTADTARPWSYGSGTDTPDPVSVAQDLKQVANRLQTAVDALVCGLNPAPDGTRAQVSLRVHFTPTACGQPLPGAVRLPDGRLVEGNPRTGGGEGVSQTYALPFVMVAEARIGPYRRNVVLQGEYRFVLGRSSFARYALFTNVHALPNGTGVWFTSRTLFDGPVHTNQQFRFYRTPWFGGEVTSAGCTWPGYAGCSGKVRYGAYFYGAGFIRRGAMRPDASRPSVTNWYGTHAPEFAAGVDWGASFIPLPQNNFSQRSAAQEDGLYFGGSLRDLYLAAVEEGGVRYQYIRAEVCLNARCRRTRVEEYRYAEDGRLYQRVRKGKTYVWAPVTRNGAQVVFNGVIFVGGQVRSLHGPSRTDLSDPATAGPALARFAQITVAAEGDVRITGDLKYEDPPCTGTPTRRPNGSVVPAECNNLDAVNVLGVYSQNGDVLLGTGTPTSLRDLTIHGVLMSARGTVQVDNYDWIPSRGEVRLLGGVIEYYYGAFGTFDARTGRNRTGYGRSFTYDQRMRSGTAPPFFPTTGLDEVQSVSLFSYGQREQVY